MTIQRQGQHIFYSSLINDAEYFSGFSSRALPDTPHDEALKQFLHNNQIPFKLIHKQNQIHSNKVRVISLHNTQPEDGDGMVTTENEVCLVVKTADCVPILYVDKKAGVIGISHNGWRGTYDNISKEIIEAMVAIGAERENILVAIGPGIGACCYDFYGIAYDNFITKYPQYADKVFMRIGDKDYLDLQKMNYYLLIDAGIKKEHIDHRPFCTQCDEEQFFSYRRDHHEHKEKFGHMVSFIEKL
jgi:YfiH family protein